MFVFTTGEGVPALRSPTTAVMLENTVGENLETILQHVPHDVITHCHFLERLRHESAIPEPTWRGMARINPTIVQPAREGAYRVCARTFLIETSEVVTLFLFYNKAKL